MEAIVMNIKKKLVGCGLAIILVAVLATPTTVTKGNVGKQAVKHVGNNMSWVVRWGNSPVIMKDNTLAVRWGNSPVIMKDNTLAVRWGNSPVIMKDNTLAVRWGNSPVIMRDNTLAVRWGNMPVIIKG
jgi:hypothetical protein